MEGNVESEENSVDIEPAIKEYTKQEKEPKDIIEIDKEVELKIVEDRDLIESENNKEFKDSDKEDSNLKEKPNLNGENPDMGETPSKDETSLETGQLENVESKTSEDNPKDENPAEIDDVGSDIDRLDNTKSKPDKQIPENENDCADITSAADSAKPDTNGTTKLVCDNKKSTENNEVMLNTQGPNPLSANTSIKDDESADINVKEEDDGIISDPVNKTEVDSFLNSVVEEIAQNMKAVEKELSDSTVVAASGNTITDSEDKATGDQTMDETKGLPNAVGELGQDCCDTANLKSEKGDKNEDIALKLEKDLRFEQSEARSRELERELQEARVQIHAAQACARDQQIRHNQITMTLKLQLYKTQTSLRQERTKSDRQLAEVMSHLMLLEGQLKREQCRMKREMKHRNTLVQDQKLEILKLREQNEQLLNAIKEICANGGMNGYMREKKKGSEVSDGGKTTKDKKVHNGKLSTVKDKFTWKNRSSLELNNFDLEKYLIKSGRMYSSHEDLQSVGRQRLERPVSNLVEGNLQSPCRADYGQKDKFVNSPGLAKVSPKSSQNFFNDDSSQKMDISTSVSESSQLSEHSSTSGFQSLSDHDLSNQDISMGSSHGNDEGCVEDDDDDDDDGRFFSFSSTRINTVINEEEATEPFGQMTSMGSMPNISNKRLQASKDRPHSLSSVDLVSIQQQAENLSRATPPHMLADMQTPPSSPSATQNKPELTPFQTFKTMFKRKGSKNKGKKRSVSLSQTTSKEYTEAMKKHFQKYDMS